MSADESSPWLGLASFTEENRSFFYGREEEVAELERRVQRKLLTLLFGKSGLGKTSILQAGLVPLLRARGYFPVYIRIDYGQDAPEPAEQIKLAIGRAAAAGHGNPVQAAGSEESIWEFLHHRDDVLKSPGGETLIPLLIFDQFEELFTLAQSDEFGRARAARFVEELADLVENRPPKAFERRLEADESLAERFDFSRGDYRVVIALREDYLAPLESLKRQMPSLSQNRLRLAPMTGSQALEAVRRPGGQLVTEEVAEAIVRFVAGGSELANAEVEPSLLSLICRELNEQRLAQQRTEISIDLLAGSHESILSRFYERALTDQPSAVRRLIEDDLLTESGYRENLSEESLLRRLRAAGAEPDALTDLVNRRLLRIEERLDVRRVELTHDVLTGVVKASRDQRHDREERAATERLLAEQHAREQVAQRAVRRARSIAAGCTILAAVAVVAAVLAIMNVQRARRAEEDARQTRAVSEQARVQAEGLLGYLTRDFVDELETLGRYQTIAELSQREIDYFRALPPQLKDPQTLRNGALALENHARALLFLGDSTSGTQSAAAAVKIMEDQLRSGDRSEATTVTLARAYSVLGMLRNNEVSPEDDAVLRRAIDLLRPIVDRPGASYEASRVYIEVEASRGLLDSNLNRNDEAVQETRDAMSRALRLKGHRDDLNLDADYTWAAAWLTIALANLGRDDEVRRAGADALSVTERLRAQRPQFGQVLLSQLVVEGALSGSASFNLNPVDAARFGAQQEQTAAALVALEPANKLYLAQLGTAYAVAGNAMWQSGQLHEAVEKDRASLDAWARLSAGAAFYVANMNSQMLDTASRQLLVGDATAAAATIADSVMATQKLNLGDSFSAHWAGAVQASLTAGVRLARNDANGAGRLARSARERWQTIRPEVGFQSQMKNFALFHLADVEGHAEYQMSHFAAAAVAEDEALQAAKLGLGVATSPRDVLQTSTWLSMALARDDKQAQAAALIDPVVTSYHALAARNHGDQWLPLELAAALYVQSLTNESKRPALLREAAQLIEHLPPSIAALPGTRAWRARIFEGRTPG